MKPEILFIHGMWSRPSVWDRWCQHFEQRGYHCHAIELPGHDVNDSDVLLAGVGLQTYVDAVTSAAAGLHRPVLIGHSLGGLIGQLVAQRLTLGGLVLINSAAPGQIFPLRLSMLPGLVRHFSQWGLWKKTFRLSPREANYLVFNQVAPSERPLLYAQLIAESGKVAYEVGFGWLNLAQSNRVQKDLINCPMLGLAGGKDRIIPLSVSRGMARWYGKKLDYREYFNNGHWLLGESNWTQCAHEVAEWVQEACLEQTTTASAAGAQPI